jgi:hypothetical protein
MVDVRAALSATLGDIDDVTVSGRAESIVERGRWDE